MNIKHTNWLRGCFIFIPNINDTYLAYLIKRMTCMQSRRKYYGKWYLLRKRQWSYQHW